MNLDDGALPTPAMDLRWMGRAACVGSGVDMFGPDTDAAKQVCSGCPVVGPCLNYATACGFRLEGVWGGMTQFERNLANSLKTHCPSGHEYNQANARIKPSGMIYCHVCNVRRPNKDELARSRREKYQALTEEEREEQRRLKRERYHSITEEERSEMNRLSYERKKQRAAS